MTTSDESDRSPVDKDPRIGLPMASVPSLAEVMAAAFLANPLSLSLFPEETTRYRRLVKGFQLYLLRVIRPHGHAVWIPEVGAALWLPPGQFPLPGWKQWLLLPGLLQVFGVRHLWPGLRTLAEIDAHHPLSEPHWYLLFLGVHPNTQGRGFGSLLLRHSLAEIDGKHSNAYLETADSRNLSLYLRAGFSVVREWDVSRGVHFWGLWRPATGKG